jgi:hypothetical protein
MLPLTWIKFRRVAPSTHHSSCLLEKTGITLGVLIVLVPLVYIVLSLWQAELPVFPSTRHSRCEIRCQPDVLTLNAPGGFRQSNCKY